MNIETVAYDKIVIHHVSGHIKKDFWSESYHSHEHAEIFIHVLGQMELFIENNIYCHSGNEIRLYAPWELHFGKADFDQDMEWYQELTERLEAVSLKLFIKFLLKLIF